jgi:catechol 2,3-dioxygenase-like lactoylglutathione lyase family enzyme
MRQVSRRLFLTAAGAALVAPRIALSADQPPTLLDHIILGCSDLDRGITFVEEHTGVRAAFGGVHPGRGTQNALVALGDRRYLEIIAPDPKQDSLRSRFGDLQSISEPRLIGWAVHPPNADTLAKRLRAAGISFEGPSDGSRKRPDEKLLRWKTVDLKDDRQGLLPFFIEWSADSPHPSIDAPPGCHLVSFSVSTPDPDELAKTFRVLEVAVTVERGNKPQLRARIAGPKGQVDLTS